MFNAFVTTVSRSRSTSSRATSVHVARETDRHAVGDHRGGRLRDLALLVVMPRALVPKRELVQHAHRDGAAMRACEQPLLLEQLEVAPDGGRRHVQARRKVGHLDAPIGREIREDRRQTFRLVHVRTIHRACAFMHVPA